jgi:hypothetical protein
MHLYRYKVLENSMLRRIFGIRRVAATRSGRELDE